MVLRESCTECCILPVVIGGRSRQRGTWIQFIIQFCKLMGIEEVELLRSRTPTKGTCIVDGIASVRAFLGGDDDNTVGTTRTIDSGGRDILQDFNTFDV